jgi:hypothetical protein
MAISLLTCSASDYAASQGRKLTDYELRGFSATERSQFMAESRLRDLAGMGCEVVVDVRHNATPGRSGTFWDDGKSPEYTVAGTGLRLKRKPRSF